VTIRDLQKVIILDAGDDQYEIRMKDLVEALNKAGYIIRKERMRY